MILAQKGFLWFQSSIIDPSQLCPPPNTNFVAVTDPVNLCTLDSNNPPQMTLQMISQLPSSKILGIMLPQQISLRWLHSPCTDVTLLVMRCCYPPFHALLLELNLVGFNPVQKLLAYEF